MPGVDLAHLQIGHIHPLPPGEAQSRLGGRSAGVEGGTGGRAFDHLLLVGLARGQVLHVDHQTARGAGHTYPAMVQAQVVEQHRDGVRQLPDGGRHILRRQLLGADLQQEWSLEFRVSSSEFRVCADLLIC